MPYTNNIKSAMQCLTSMLHDICDQSLDGFRKLNYGLDSGLLILYPLSQASFHAIWISKAIVALADFHKKAID